MQKRYELTITSEEAAAAFDEWNKRTRDHPEEFNQGETSGAAFADYFFKLIEEGRTPAKLDQKLEKAAQRAGLPNVRRIA